MNIGKATVTLIAIILATSFLSSCGKPHEDVTVRVVGLNGPTGMGLAYMNSQSDEGKTTYRYDISYASAPDAITGELIGGSIDIAAVPVNLAAVLYNKTQGEILTCAVNTLGVLSIIAGPGTEVDSFSSLAGRTIVTAGQGSTPEYIINYLLEANGIAGQVDIEFVSEHAECLTQLLQGKADLIMVPEPFVTNVLNKVEGSHVLFDLTEEWAKVSDTELVQGVLAVRKAFAAEHPEIMKAFLEEYAESVNYTNEHPKEASEIIAGYGIVASAPLAGQAIPRCNICCLTGADCRGAMDAMLEVLFSADPKAIGGALPEDDIYYIP